MQLLDLDMFDPAVREWPTAKLMMLSSSFATWFFKDGDILKWHGDLRIHATEAGYQRLVDKGPDVPTAIRFGFRRVAVEGEALDEYRRQFDAWLDREMPG